LRFGHPVVLIITNGQEGSVCFITGRQGQILLALLFALF